jgi:hypothetical protein
VYRHKFICIFYYTYCGKVNSIMNMMAEWEEEEEKATTVQWRKISHLISLAHFERNM